MSKTQEQIEREMKEDIDLMWKELMTHSQFRRQLKERKQFEKLHKPKM